MSTNQLTSPHASTAAIHRLSNGRYQVLISDTGAGQSSWNGLALNRWRNDPIEDDLGSILYLRDLDNGRFWSLGYQPTRTPTGRYRAASADGGGRVVAAYLDGREIPVGADAVRITLPLRPGSFRIEARLG
ncbi:MAG: hypothetical protein WCA32_14720 [Chromatiaceae bacterium]